MNFNEALRQIIETYQKSYYEGGGGFDSDIIKHEIGTRDYLSFCDKIIDRTDIELSDRIELISNLKRACDCQLDILFEFLNINDVIRSRNIGFEKKINIIYELGLFPKRSILRISEIRNKVEHEFRKPAISEVAVYNDLVYALIIVIEKQIQILMNCSDIDIRVSREKNQWYSMKYNHKEKKILIAFNNMSNSDEYQISILRDYNEFIKALHLYFLIIQNNYRSNDEYTINELNKLFN